MAKPILNGPGIVPGVCQCVSAAVTQLVGVDREREASTRLSLKQYCGTSSRADTMLSLRFQLMNGTVSYTQSPA